MEVAVGCRVGVEVTVGVEVADGCGVEVEVTVGVEVVDGCGVEVEVTVGVEVGIWTCFVAVRVGASVFVAGGVKVRVGVIVLATILFVGVKTSVKVAVLTIDRGR